VSNFKAPKPELWVGLVELRRFKRDPVDGPGAFASVVTWASNAEEFRKKAETLAATLDMFVVEVEDVEPVAVRAKDGGLTQAIEDLVVEAESNPDAILLDVLHNYLQDDA